MPGRTRFTAVPHEYVEYPGPLNKTALYNSRHMVDATGPKIGQGYPDRVLRSSKIARLSGSVTNRFPVPATGTGDVGYPSILYVNCNNVSFYAASSAPPIGALVLQLLAGTNPGAPSMNLPLFMLELRDIPKMLKHAGDLLHGLKDANWRKFASAKELAAGNLALKFGWQPLIEDLNKLLDFSQYVDRRMASLSKLASGKGDKRKQNLFSNSVSWKIPDRLMVGRAPSIKVTLDLTQTEKITGTVTWKPTGFAPIPTSRSEALKLALGLNLGNIPLTLWQSIPWSWLIDWFGGVSNYLKSKQGGLSYLPSKISITNRTKLIVTHPSWPLGSEDPKLYPGEAEYQKVSRDLPSIPSFPVLRVPIFDAYKMSVLGSLAVLRLNR